MYLRKLQTHFSNVGPQLSHSIKVYTELQALRVRVGVKQRKVIGTTSTPTGGFVCSFS